MNVFEMFAKLSFDDDDFRKGLKNASEESESFGSKFGKGLKQVGEIGAKALAGATTAVVAFGATAVKSGAEFDSAMSQVVATMGMAIDENGRYIKDGEDMTETMQRLRDYAQEMGSKTAFSASQSAEALNYMALAGYSVEDSMAMLPTVLNLASAGGMELATASDMVTDASSALGLNLEETAELVDKMATTSSKSNTSVSQLGEAMLAIGATANMMSGGTTELSTALGILADNGTKGAEGGTRLRNILLSLGAPTEQASELMKALGFSAYDANGEMKPLEQSLEELNSAMEGMTSEEKTNIISTLFNKADIGDVNYLLGVSSERWDELSVAIDNSTGSAENMATVQLDNLSGDITLFKSALEGAQIAISDGLTPSLRGFVQFGSKALSTLTDAYKKDGVDGAMKASKQLLTEGIGMLTREIPKLVETGAKLITALVQGIADNSGLIAESASSVLVTLAQGIIDNLPTIINSAFDIIMALATGLADQLPTLIPQAIEMILTIVEGLIDNADKLVDGAIALMIGLAEGLIGAIPRIIEKVPEIVLKLLIALKDNAPKILEAGVKILDMLWQGIKDNLWSLGAKVPEIIQTVKDKLTEGVDKLKEVGKDWLEGLWNGINDKVEWLYGKIKDFTDGIVGQVKKFFGIASPSKVMRQVGVFLAEGLGEGWSDEYSSVKRQITDSLSMDLTSSIRINGKANNQTNQLIKAVNDLNNNMYENMVEALQKGLVWEWDNRQLGRMVRTYA